MAFPQPTAQNTEGQLIVEWRAGRCRYDETAKKVHPDPRKGMFRLVIADDGITHVHWLERNKTGAVPEHDFMVIGDAYLEKLDYVKDGRCYILKFEGSGDRKFFIWQQEPDEEKDDELKKNFCDRREQKITKFSGEPRDARKI
jgi:26S proteasome regulatory subunit N13